METSTEEAEASNKDEMAGTNAKKEAKGKKGKKGEGEGEGELVVSGGANPPMLEDGVSYKVRFADGIRELDGAKLDYAGCCEYDFWFSAMEHARTVNKLNHSFTCVWIAGIRGHCKMTDMPAGKSDGVPPGYLPIPFCNFKDDETRFKSLVFCQTNSLPDPIIGNVIFSLQLLTLINLIDVTKVINNV